MLHPNEVNAFQAESASISNAHLSKRAFFDNFINMGLDKEKLANISYFGEKTIEPYPEFVIVRSSKALEMYQRGEIDLAEKELRKLIRNYPMLADSRAALTALLWRQGSVGEAKSHWAAVKGLDSRYKQRDWILKIRHWPTQPIDDLMGFLAFESS